MRRPAPLWFIFRGRLPQSLAIRAFPSVAEASGAGAGPDGANGGAVEELALLADWILALLEEVLVSPRVSLHPGPDEISPELLDAEDVNFIIRWHTARSARTLETTSSRFAQSGQLLLLAQVAQTWSCRPSELVEATGTTALQIDIAAALALWRWQEQLAQQTKKE